MHLALFLKIQLLRNFFSSTNRSRNSSYYYEGLLGNQLITSKFTQVTANMEKKSVIIGGRNKDAIVKFQDFSSMM